MAGILNIQLKPVLGNKDVNLRKVEHFISQNSDKKLDLVVLPEFFSTGVHHESFLNAPEDENGGKTIESIKSFAQKYNTNIVAGTVIEKSGDKLYNTCFVINRDGETVGKYRKIHLYNYMGGTEGERITAGDELELVKLDFATIGLGICFDIRYPLHYKELTKQGAEIIVLPTAWLVPTEVYQDKESLDFAQETWVALNKIRAFDNLVYVVSCNQTKEINDNISALGNSMIVAPTTQVLANAELDQCATYADINIEIVKYYKSIYPIAQID